MDIEIKLEEGRKTPKVIILTDRITDEVSELVQRLKTSSREIVSGIKDGCVEIISVASLVRIYSADKKVMIRTDSGEFLSRQRLYEFEEILDSTSFVR
ncbi:MAG: LytTR family DNA-binding domain-containing protein, partial [Acutalibacteraceae bacterium]